MSVRLRCGVARAGMVVLVACGCTPRSGPPEELRTTTSTTSEAAPPSSSLAPASPLRTPARSAITIPAKATPPTHLVVLLHGVGADAASFADLGRTLARGLPRADFLVVDGFHPWDGGGSGRQWFSLRGVTDANRGQRIRDAGVEVSEYLDDELGRRHLGGERLVLVGFSQGAMMTGYLTVHRTPRPAAAVMLSGRVAMDDVPTKAESPTPLLWAHGDADGVIPVSAVEPGTRVLQTWGAQVTTRIYPGMGHQVSPQELTEVEDFLRGVLPKAN